MFFLFVSSMEPVVFAITFTLSYLSCIYKKNTPYPSKVVVLTRHNTRSSRNSSFLFSYTLLLDKQCLFLLRTHPKNTSFWNMNLDVFSSWAFFLLLRGLLSTFHATFYQDHNFHPSLFWQNNREQIPNFRGIPSHIRVIIS